MQTDRLDKLLQRFTIAARAHHTAMEAMNAERAEHHARMTGALFAAIMDGGAAGRKRFSALLDHADPVVAGMAAVYLISSDTERSLATLQRVAAEPGLLGFRAAAAIERWQSGDWQ
jgi:hypothetical protein